MTDLRKDLFTTGKILKTVSLCLLFSISSGQLSAEENWYDFSLDWIKPDTSPEGKVDHPPVTLEDNDFGKNTEQHYPPNQVFTLWVSDESLFQPDANDTVEVKQVLEKETKTHKLENKVPPIGFRSGVADIPDSYVERLRTVLNEMKSRKNVRLHFVGHTDSDKLSPALQAKYGNNVGLSRSRAQMAAEYFQQALDLAPDSVSFDGVGDSKPLASNATADGRRKNRRVEIQVWYDEINEKMVDKAVVIKAEKLNRLKVCREETVCQLTYKEGTGKRIRLKNLVKPLRRNVGETGLTDEFMRQITEAYKNLRGKQNVIIHFVGHTDNMPLDSAERRIYGDHTNLSKARARYVALEVQSRMGLPNRSISSTGKGSQYPVSSNGTEKGRFLNRRVEVEFWYDDPFEEITEAPQACPEVAGSETITLTYDPLTGPFQPVYFTAGQPVIPPGLTNRIRRTMDEIKDKANVRVSFIGYTNNERLSRRVADVYGDDLGLSTARARRTMQLIQKEMNLKDGQVEFIGRGFVHSDDVVSDGFTQLSEARVEIKILYDELALMEDQENLTIDRLNREAVAHNPYSLNLMRITVDGDPVYDMNKSSQDIQRCTDVALDDAKIQFRFNNLQVKPRLSITAWPDVIRYQDDVETDVEENRVYFKTYSNYSSFVKKAEIRLFNTEQSITSEPLFVVPVDKNNQAEWFADFEQFSAHTKKLNFVLRVYLDDEKYDETRPQPLWIVDNLETTQIARSDALKDNAEKNNQLTQGYGENQLVRQQAYINGGTVTVNGSGIPAGHKVWLAGKSVPVNENGEFVAEEILPKGQHTVEVAVLDQEGNGELYLRDLAFNKNDWFYVALGDLTVAKGNTTGPAQLVTQNESQFDEEMNVNGRFAYFTEGEFGDGWKLISSADTREGKVDELFTNFLDKDPRALFRRLDPDLFYPSFADDSSIEEKAPTSGKLYLKLQNDKDYGLLGNFTVDYMDTRLSQVDRGLYGTNLHLESDDFTSFGEQKFMIDAFGAEPGTVAGRDEFRSTGGSLYFLQNQDVLMGSERLRVEIRDKDSGIVIGVKNLTPALDYDVDYIQGRIMLSQPLASFAEDSLIRADSSVGGNPVYLIARYEYTPGFDEIDDLAFGLRSHYWFNDNFKMGVTFNKQEMDLGETRLDGVDFTLRKSADTWLKVESASSMGAGSTAFASNDGGFGFSSIENGFENGLLPDEKKKALHIEANILNKDLFENALGKASFYYQDNDAGFNAPGQLSARAMTKSGLRYTTPIAEAYQLDLKYDKQEQTEGLSTEAVEAAVSYQVDEKWQITAASRSDSREDQSPVVPLTQKQGERLDFSVKASFDSKEKWRAYGYVQSTLETDGNREENDRVGFGGSFRVSDDFTLDGEISSGELGEGAKIGTEYIVSEKTSLYSNYTLENSSYDNGMRVRRGNWNSGVKSRLTDSLSIYGEEKYTHGDVPVGLTHAFGVEYSVKSGWDFGANLESGTLEDKRTASIVERQALGLNTAYHKDAITYSFASEYRVDNTENPDLSFSERTTWLIKNDFKYQINDDWRFVSRAHFSETESTQGDLFGGNFSEVVMGYGYRPVENDKWNALFKYTYFYNVPVSQLSISSPLTGQVSTLQNPDNNFIQKSHIMSLDFIYDLTESWSVGSKVAYRLGQVALDRTQPQYFDSRATLVVMRADWHFTKQWDALIEARQLKLPDAQDQRTGALIGIYRHIGNNLKVGLGYNFADFSDDLTDLDYNHQGVFINIVGKL